MKLTTFAKFTVKDSDSLNRLVNLVDNAGYYIHVDSKIVQLLPPIMEYTVHVLTPQSDDNEKKKDNIIPVTPAEKTTDVEQESLNTCNEPMKADNDPVEPEKKVEEKEEKKPHNPYGLVITTCERLFEELANSNTNAMFRVWLNNQIHSTHSDDVILPGELEKANSPTVKKATLVYLNQDPIRAISSLEKYMKYRAQIEKEVESGK